MEILLSDLNYQKEILIDETISYDSNYLKKSDILKLNNVKVTGKIYKDYEENTALNLEVVGTMYLIDAISALEVPYPFKITIEENLENSLKTLDLTEFIWYYIVLEIPIRYTTCDTEDLKNKYPHIYSEEEIREVNNPFKDFFKE